ncbi:hypothetical protein MVEN_01226100 [Mycena venus]|uniref:Uncharacterized protein n=1 Tax=Mycena venus TaxID=2733690 RepID=A0A8H6Y5J5_9AGAR|nr:hypothetical protein MVEN_01226100 [Mycena venus]
MSHPIYGPSLFSTPPTHTPISMSKERFPRRLPATEPPPPCGEIVDGHRTPTYALAWTCSFQAFFENMGECAGEKVDGSNFTDAVSAKWNACPTDEFDYGLNPRHTLV